MELARGEKKNEGFSLMELAVVIAIMAILVGVLAPAYLRYVEKSRRRVDDSAAEEIRHAAEIVVLSGGFRLDNGDVLVTFNASGVRVMQGDVGNALLQSLTADFGDLSDVVPRSKLRKDQTYSVEISTPEGGSTTSTPKIVGSWDGPDD